MPAQTFFCRLISPRPTFIMDLSPAEAKSMQEHAGYWRGKMAEGKVVTFGLVGDPAGAFGIGVVEVADLAEAQRMTAEDPAILGIPGMRYEIHPMPFGAVYPPR